MRTPIVSLFTLVILVAIVNATRSRSKGRNQAAPLAGGAAAAGGGGGGAHGKLPQLKGVNRAGTEFSCVKGTGLYEGPVDDAAIQNMVKWKINAVRVPLNEDCWLGTNGVNSQYGGAAYKTFIKDYVKRLRKAGLYVVLDLHWTTGIYTGNGQGACSDEAAKCQKPMPGKGAIKFWSGVAGEFKDDHGVIFDIFNEPFPDQAMDKAQAWKCWANGGSDCKGINYPVVGMKTLLETVRKAGANNLCMLGGLEWANDLDGWLEHVPKDKNIAASMHSYDFNACKDEGCWEKGIGKISQNYPVIVGEIGQHGCAHDYVDKIMPWLDKKKISFLAWTFNKWDCGSGPALITDWDGSPTEFGKGVKEYLEKNPATKAT